MELANPLFYKDGRIDILIGAELFFSIMSVGQVKLANHLPILQKTLLGWVVSGGVSRPQHSWSLAVSEDEDKLYSLVKSFRDVENSFEDSSFLLNEEKYCERHCKVLHMVSLVSGCLKKKAVEFQW